MKQATQATYDPEQLEIQAWTRPLPSRQLRMDPRVRVLDPPDSSSTLLSLPRYEPFTETVTELARQGVQFIEIAGNRTIVLTVIAPRDWQDTRNRGRVMHEWEILTHPSQKRVAIAVPVARLHAVIPSLEAEQVQIDHLYDY